MYYFLSNDTESIIVCSFVIAHLREILCNILEPNFADIVEWNILFYVIPVADYSNLPKTDYIDFVGNPGADNLVLCNAWCPQRLSVQVKQ